MYEKSLSGSGALSIRPLRAAVVLDRDGTIIDDVGYLADPEGINCFPGVPEALKRLQDRGYLLVVITNRSGIGREYFNGEWEDKLRENADLLWIRRENGVRWEPPEVSNV